ADLLARDLLAGARVDELLAHGCAVARVEQPEVDAAILGRGMELDRQHLVAERELRLPHRARRHHASSTDDAPGGHSGHSRTASKPICTTQSGQTGPSHAAHATSSSKA